jgi:hypothetical protein
MSTQVVERHWGEFAETRRIGDDRDFDDLPAGDPDVEYNARLASCLAAIGERPTMGAISSP